MRKGLLHKVSIGEGDGEDCIRKNSRREGLAECESAMAQEKDIAECVAKADRTVRRSESRIRSRAKRTLLGRERRSESRNVAEDKRASERNGLEDKRARRKVARKGVAQKVRGRNFRESCAEGKKEDSAKDDKMAQRTRGRRKIGSRGRGRKCEEDDKRNGAEKRNCAEEKKMRGKEKPRGREKQPRGREKKSRRKDRWSDPTSGSWRCRQRSHERKHMDESETLL